MINYSLKLAITVSMSEPRDILQPSHDLLQFLLKSFSILSFFYQKIIDFIIEFFLCLPQLVVVILIVFQLVHAVNDTLGHHEVLVLAEESEIQGLEVGQVGSLGSVVGGHELLEVEEVVGGVLELLDASVLLALLSEELDQLVAFYVESLECSLQLEYPLLMFLVLVLLGDGEIGLKLVPGKPSEDSSSITLFDLFPSFELLPLGQELLDFFAVLGIVLRLIEQFGEKAFNDSDASIDEGLVLDHRHLALHEGEDAVLGKGGEDESRLPLRQDLEEQGEVRVAALDSRDLLLEFEELELVVLALEQVEVHLVLGGGDLGLEHLDGRPLARGLLPYAVLDELVVAVDHLEVV